MRKQLAVVILLSGFTQFAALSKSVLIAYYFGIGADLDGYYLAQAVPAVLAGVIAGFLQAGLLPTYAGHIGRKEFDGAAALLARMLVALGIVAAILSAMLSASAPLLVSSMAPEASASVQQAATTSLRVLAFLLLLNALVDSLSLALNAHGAFATASLAPTINIVVASVLLVAFPEWGLANLIWGTLIGLCAQLFMIAFEFRRRRIGLHWAAAADLKPTLRAGIAIIPGLILANLTSFVPQIIAVRLGDGAVATFAFAMRMHGAIIQVLAIALSTVLLPHFAQMIGRNEHSLIAHQLRRGFPIAALVAVATLLWVGLVGQSIVSLMFERGAFDYSNAVEVANTWFWLTAGLLPATWGVVLAKVLLALRRGITMSLVAFFSFLLLVVFGVTLASAAGLPGLAVAVGLSMLGATIVHELIVSSALLERSSKLTSNRGAERARLCTAVLVLATASIGSHFLLVSVPSIYKLMGVTLVIAVTLAVLLFGFLTRHDGTIDGLA